MKCQRCEGRAPGAAPRGRSHNPKVWGADRISGLRCTACGTLLDADDIAQLLLEKQSQLERVGLLTPPSGVAPESQLSVAVQRRFRLEKN